MKTQTDVIFLRREFYSPYYIVKYINLETLKVGQLFYEYSQQGNILDDAPLYVKTTLELWLK